MNGKTITCHDCHGFKWKNINICPLLIVFLCGPMSFLAHWIVTTPKLGPIINIVFKKFLNMRIKVGSIKRNSTCMSQGQLFDIFASLVKLA
jgi:hypothetical protein